MDSAKAKRDIEDLEGRVRNLRGEFTKAGRHIDDFEGDINHAAGSVGRLAGGLKTLDRNVHLGVGGLREMGRAAQVAERQIQKLYQTYAAAQLKNKQVPQSMASWLPGSGVSQSTKDQVLGANTGTNSNVITALRQEEKAREANIAAIKREKTARQELNATTAQEARYRQHGDQYGRLAEARLRDADAARQQNDAYVRLMRTNSRDAEASRASQEAYSSATRNRIQSANNLRAAEEQHAQSAARSIEQQNKLRATQQKGLTTAQGRLQAEEEAAAYRKLEGAVGRAEAAKRGLAAAQRQVNAAQQALKSATGDIVMQTAATNRLADAKRRLAQAEAAARTAQQPAGNMDSTRYALYDVGATAGMAAAIGGLAIGATVKNFAGLETQFATVSRTSEETGHNLTVMTDRLLDMGSVIPIPLQGLTDMAARAAQLGVEGQKNILAFTEVMSKFAAISDTVTETEVAEYFGRLNNLTGNMGNWEEMADAVARVGITSAATDQQVLKTAQEIAQAGAGANYSQKEIIGLAGAFASLAVPPERARSVLLDLNKIMTQGMGESTESMKSLSAQMGISEEAIRGMWRAKPTELISEMAKSLKDMEPEEVMTFLSDFGLKGARALPVFMAIAKDAKNAGEGLSVFDKAQHEVENSSGELEKQFSITMETLAAAWQTFINSVQAGGFDAMSDIGPILTDVLNIAGDLMDWIREFLGSDIGGYIGSTVLVLGGLATALTAAGAGAAIFAASMLAIKSAAASGIFGANIGGLIGGLGAGGKASPITGAAASMTLLGKNAGLAAPKVTQIGKAGMIAAPYLNQLGTNATAAQRAVAGIKGAGTVASRAVGGLVSAIGPAGLAVTGIALGIGYLANSAATASAETEKLGVAITTLDEAGKRMSTADMFSAAGAGFAEKNPIASRVSSWGSDLGLRPDAFEFDKSGVVDYMNELKSLEKLNRSGAKITEGLFGYNPSLAMENKWLYGDFSEGLSGISKEARVAKQSYGELGDALAEVSYEDAAATFRELNETWTESGGRTQDLVTALGGNFSDAMWDAGTAAGSLKGEMGGANQNIDLGAALLDKSATSAQAAKDQFQATAGVLEEMGEEAVGAFSGMAENSAAMNELFGGMIAGAAASDTLKTAIEGLKVVNEETGEATGEVIDIYDDAAGTFNLTTEAARNALGALGGYGEAQAAGISSTHEWLKSMVGEEEAWRQTAVSMDAARTEFIASAEAMGIPTAAAEELANKVGLIPGYKVITLDLSGAATAAEAVDSVRNKLGTLPANTPVNVEALTMPAQMKLIELGYQVEQMPDGSFMVSADTAQAEMDLANFVNTSWNMRVNAYVDYYEGDDYTQPKSYSTSPYQNGGQKFSADGGMAGSAKKFADGRYTGGGGGKWSPAGVVHAKEYVFPARAVDPSRGIPTQDALGRMMQQHYPQAMSPNIVVQGGGGNGGVVALDAGTMHQLARMVSTQVNLNGQVLASSVNGQNKTSAQRGSN